MPVRPKILDGPNRFKLAAFGFNMSGGLTMTKAPGTVDSDWGQSLRLARAAERTGPDAVIPVDRWRQRRRPGQRLERAAVEGRLAAEAAPVDHPDRRLRDDGDADGAPDPGGGFFVVDEQPGAFVDAVDRFLRR